MKFKRKPAEIEAVQWTGKNKEEILSFCKTAHFDADTVGSGALVLKTEKVYETVEVGDYVIKGVDGTFYACNPETFALSYEVA